MKHVAFISVSGGLGGAERALVEMVTALGSVRPAWRRSVVSFEEGPACAKLREAGAEVRILPLPERFAAIGETGRSAVRTAAALALSAPALARYARGLGRVIGELRPDVVHTNGFKAHVLGARLSRPSRPIVWHVHDYPGRRPLSASLLRQSASRVAAVAAVSDSVAADVRAVIGAGSKVVTVHNAIDLDRFVPEGALADLDALAGLPPAMPSTVRIGLVATYATWKGHDVFLRAVAALPPDVPVRGYVIGGPIYRTSRSQHALDDLRRLASEVAPGGRIGFVPFRDDPAPVYRALDIVVHASTSPEPFGLSIAEAMACGRAVIASRAGGAIEVLGDSAHGMWHVPGDHRDLADRMLALARDEAARRRLGAAASARARRLFSRARLADDLCRLYAGLSRQPAAAAVQ